MKKSIKIFISFLALNFFAQACFASYAINPEVQKSIQEYAEKQMDYDEIKYDKRQKTMRVVGIIALVALGLFVLFNVVLPLVVLIIIAKV